MIRPALLIVTAGLCLAGCAQMEKMFKPEETAQAEPAPVASKPNLYCYRTLSVADCHPEPRPNSTHRLIGYEGTPPPPR